MALFSTSHPEISQGKANFIKQPTEGITYAEKIQNNEKLLNPKEMTAIEIDRTIRAFHPFTGTFLNIINNKTQKQEEIKIHKARVITDSVQLNFQVGEFIDDNLTMLCKDNTLLQLLELQRPNKEKITAQEFLNSYYQ